MSGARHQVREQPTAMLQLSRLNQSIEPTECRAVPVFTCATIKVPGYLSYTVWRHTLGERDLTLPR